MAENRAPEETLDGITEVVNLPLPKDVAAMKDLAPLIVRQTYRIDYLHSYGQDSPFFAGLTNRRLLGSRCPACGHVYATPKASCMQCGADTDWFELPREGKVHAFTVCHYGSEEFLPECPFVLALVELPGADTLLLTRLRGFDPEKPSLDWVGRKVKARFRRLSKLKPTDVWFEPA